MKRSLSKFIENKNIGIIERNNTLFITLEPYNRVIDKEYADWFLKKLKQLKTELLEHFGKETFVFAITDHNVDGLYESNSLLLNPNSMAYPNY